MMSKMDLVSNEKDDLAGHISGIISHIDRYLAGNEIKLSDRPLRCAIEYVEQFIIAVDVCGGEGAPPGKVDEFIKTQWFAIIFYHVDNWYRNRYRDFFEKPAEETINGVIEIAATPFAIKIPKTKSRPGKPGKTVWLSFPDGVREGEDPLDWIEAGPNVELLDSDDRVQAETEALKTANQLRHISTSLMAVAHTDTKIAGLMAGILPRLERAALSILQRQDEFVQQACWEIQLACESALKALRQQQVNEFRHTHNLFILFDDADPKPDFPRAILKKLPKWEDAANMRYGTGDRISRRQCIEIYRNSLIIVAGTIHVMNKLGIGNAEFEIARPPWYEFIDKSKS